MPSFAPLSSCKTQDLIGNYVLSVPETSVECNLLLLTLLFWKRAKKKGIRFYQNMRSISRHGKRGRFYPAAVFVSIFKCGWGLSMQSYSCPYEITKWENMRLLLKHAANRFLICYFNRKLICIML